MKSQVQQNKLKAMMVEQLKKIPIIQLACEKVGLSRATFYRWRKTDVEFATQIEEALDSGVGIINDMAESQLITAIRDGNLTAMIFWLKNHHSTYASKLLVSATVRRDDEELTVEQAEMVERALRMAGLPVGEVNEDNVQG